ncbi:MAG: hypothetical protein KDN05_01555 [Verrucomicrobiae bacterium]|nr:hypothetical protein [Verrucomicrobiae bacterium]
MKTTLELPDETFRQAKARAALRGIPMKQFVTEALEEKLRSDSSQGAPAPSPPWMRGFGALADLREENRRLEGLIAEEFGKIEPEDEA